MAGFIPNGISSTDKRPSIISTIQFAQGEGSSGSGSRDILLIGTYAGDGYVASLDGYGPHEMKTEAQVAYYFGARSQLRRMYRAVVGVNPNVRIFAAYTLGANAGDKATGTITFTGTAQGPGSVNATVCGEAFTIAFAKNDTANTIGANLVAQISANAWLPVEAANVNGQITLSAAAKGIEGNEFTFTCSMTPGLGVTVANSGTKLTGGVGVPEQTPALDAMVNSKVYYQVFANNDAANVAEVATQIKTLAEPTSNVLQVGIFGSVDTGAAARAITQLNTVNNERIQCVHLYNSQTPSCEIAAMVAGLRAKYEINDFGHNLNGIVVPCKPPVSKADYPTNNDLRANLEGGVSPLGVNKFGGITLISSRSTRCLNGTAPDYRASKTYIVSVSDAFAADTESDMIAAFTGCKVMADTKDPPRRGVVQPKHLRAKLIKWLEQYVADGQLDGAMLPKMIASLICVKTTGTLSGQYALYCMEDLDHVYAIGLESSSPQ